MINRIKEVAQYYGLSSTAFADKVEVPRPVISHIFSERNRPSLEVVQKIGLAFPEVDLGWLLYGKGGMLKEIANEEVLPEAIPKLQENTPEQTIQKGESNSPKQDPILPTISQHVLLNVPGKKKAVKIVFVYDDNTFEEYFS